jgi:hypothetical protein
LDLLSKKRYRSDSNSCLDKCRKKTCGGRAPPAPGDVWLKLCFWFLCFGFCCCFSSHLINIYTQYQMFCKYMVWTGRSVNEQTPAPRFHFVCTHAEFSFALDPASSGTNGAHRIDKYRVIPVVLHLIDPTVVPLAHLCTHQPRTTTCKHGEERVPSVTNAWRRGTMGHRAPRSRDPRRKGAKHAGDTS